ncbi:tyrosyl-tRNA synthetase-like protein [Lophiotrema nucula]|uniref:Tyrosine--tRNA ligase n=1 Tax=Lophiotrema nucula TaxID=690887 RepID=A0A6A5YQL4_9PLEO|nr:tyrosyl-tRNA synthetase-like protein [Lophiotrema nucula]
MAAIPLFRHLPRARPYVCQQCIRRRSGGLPREARRTLWAGASSNEKGGWSEQAGRIRSGAQQSMLDVLEERGFVKDVAGGRKALDWLLTQKPVGAYVGVDPTAPSLHVGHLLPLMALYWMYLHGYYTVTLLGGGTVQIGDPSGRTSARQRQAAQVQEMNVQNMHTQLKRLWVHVRELGIKHKFSPHTSRRRALLNNQAWLQRLNAVNLMRDLGSGMRLGTMLSRDSVKTRMQGGDGMAISEFCYPLFQGYDWWHMYAHEGVQLQLGGSDQYGNICAGIDAVSHMRNLQRDPTTEAGDDPREGIFGLTTPLLTTASGEKFGKSAGNAVWLDRDMMSSFDLYQYFLRTADDDVERYLKLFTFLPLDKIALIMNRQRDDASKRRAQHLLAKEVVELAHGTIAAKDAEIAHRDAFSQGTGTFFLYALRNLLQKTPKQGDTTASSQRSPEYNALQAMQKKKLSDLRVYKQSFAGQTASQQQDASKDIITLPKSLFEPGSFPRILHAAGLVSSKSEAHRLIQNRGAYIVIPNSGTIADPYTLKWEPIPKDISKVDPTQYLVDWSALVLRVGKSKIQICRIGEDEEGEEQQVDVTKEKEEQNAQLQTA